MTRLLFITIALFAILVWAFSGFKSPDFSAPMYVINIEPAAGDEWPYRDGAL